MKKFTTTDGAEVLINMQLVETVCIDPLGRTRVRMVSGQDIALVCTLDAFVTRPAMYTGRVAPNGTSPGREYAGPG